MKLVYSSNGRPIPAALFSFQKEAAEWLDRYGSGILALDQGLGKTAVSLSVFDPPGVVVCGASHTQNWGREVQKWRPDLSFTVLGVDKHPNMHADIIILNYEKVKGVLLKELVARRNNTLVVDEAQVLKDLRVSKDKERGRWIDVASGSKRARHIWWLARHCFRRFLLTGTPMINGRHSELFPLLHIVDPGSWGTFEEYAMYYCAKGEGYRTYVINKNAEHLHKIIDNVYMFRRTKSEIQDMLPEKQRFTKVVTLHTTVMTQYQRARSQFLQWVSDHGGPEAALRADRAQAITKLTALRKIAAKGKVDAVTDDAIAHVLSTQTPLVIMGHHREALLGICASLDNHNIRHERRINYGMVFGNMTPQERQKNIDLFQEGKLDVLICSIASAGTGLTLTAAQTMYFIERAWRPYDNLQAEDRIHRITQKNQCQITYYEAYMTVDSYIATTTQNKAENANVTIEGSKLSEEEAVELVYGDLLEDKSDPGAHAC